MEGLIIKEDKMKILKLVINIILVSVICICIYKILDINAEYKKADDFYEAIRNEKEEKEDEEDEGNNNFQIRNNDYRGWITIDNTNIDYPVLQGKDNTYYLDKNINNEYLRAGSIFMNYCNNGFQDNNTILFGHNMKNGSMFANLNKYKKREFFYDNNNINIETNDGDNLTYEVFSVYITDVKDNYIQSNFENKSHYEEYLKKIQNKSLYKSDIEVNGEDKIITLSTCTFQINDGRLVVHGRLVK